MRNINENYQISQNGEVYSLRYKRFLKPFKMKSGYLQVRLGKGEVNKLIHRLVAEAYIENKNNYKEVNHIDGNKENNYYLNLEWTSRSGNLKHAHKIGLRKAIIKTGEENGNSKLKEHEVLQIRKLYSTGNYTQIEIGNLYGVKQCIIQYIISRKSWKHI